MDENTIKRVAMAIDPRAFQPEEHFFESWRAQAEEKAMKQAREAIAAMPVLTEEETSRIAEQILAKVKEMVKIPLMPQGMPEQIWSRSMEEAARILSHGFNMSDQTRDGFLNTVKKDPRWREMDAYPWKEVRSPSIVLTDPALTKQAEEAAEAGEFAGEFQVIKDKPGTWTRIDTLAYKGEMEGMRNKAWTEGVEHAIAILKENGYDTAAFQLGSQTIRHWRWKK